VLLLNSERLPATQHYRNDAVEEAKIKSITICNNDLCYSLLQDGIKRSLHGTP
jgi:hypothetical protein